jgi:hypothetical protein
VIESFLKENPEIDIKRYQNPEKIEMVNWENVTKLIIERLKKLKGEQILDVSV